MNQGLTRRYSNAWQWEDYNSTAIEQDQGGNQAVPSEEDGSAGQSNDHVAHREKYLHRLRRIPLRKIISRLPGKTGTD